MEGLPKGLESLRRISFLILVRMPKPHLSPVQIVQDPHFPQIVENTEIKKNTNKDSI